MKPINGTVIMSLAIAGLGIVLSPSLGLATETQEQTPAPKEQTLCPVLGGEIDRAVYLDHEGERVYFCCANCREAFAANPEMYLQKLKEQGVMLAAAPRPQTHCPVMGGEIDRSVYTDYEGERIYFCCPPCIERFQSDPAKYLKALKDAGITLGKVPTEQAPPMDEHAH